MKSSYTDKTMQEHPEWQRGYATGKHVGFKIGIEVACRKLYGTLKAIKAVDYTRELQAELFRKHFQNIKKQREALNNEAVE